MGKLIGGSALLFLSLFMLLGFFNVSQPLGVPAAALTLLVAVGIPGAAGAALLRGYFHQRRGFDRHREQLRLQTYEAELLKLAERKGGKLTVVEVVAETALDPPTVEAALSRLVEQGVADIEITASGLLVYAFRDVQQLPEKGSSKGILDE